MATYHPRYSNRKQTGKRKGRRVIAGLLLVFVILLAAFAWLSYTVVIKPNVYTADQQQAFITIPTGSGFSEVKKALYSHGYIINRRNFEWVARFRHYPESVKPGRYRIDESMSNLDLVNLLRSGAQTPVRLTFNNIRTRGQLAGRLATQIEADSASFIKLFNDSVFLDSLNVTKTELFNIFMPDTYEVYWDTPARSVIKRMKTEADKFWEGERNMKLERIKLSRNEAITLASIVEKETNKNDEKARVAGVYMNRLKNGWLLEADPTLVFAHGDFGIRRVLAAHKTINSPYNTYLYHGLPPGPIYLPSKASIDAVLNYEDHQYMFFCAREDFSGYHNFARTLDQHNLNAYKYRQALNRRNIYK